MVLGRSLGKLLLIVLQTVPGIALSADLTFFKPGAGATNEVIRQTLDAFSGPHPRRKAGPMVKLGPDLVRLHFEHREFLK